MKIACCIWALSGAETDVLRQVRELGFDWIDIQPTHLRALESRLLAQELGLRVSCLGASFGMPAGASLDAGETAARQAAIDYVASAIRHGADLGADAVYLVPPSDRRDEALERYAASLENLAETAERRDIKLAIEHFPGKALPTASETLEFISSAPRARLHLLLDTGHLQMSGEAAESAIANAGERLAYVHLDDNDGLSDWHWSLADGLMTEETLVETLRALKAVGYHGALSLELSPALPNPARALAESRDFTLRALHRVSLGQR